MEDDSNDRKVTILAVYDPPKLGMPWLAVAILPSGNVQAVIASTAVEAETIVNGIAEKLGNYVW